ncbi:MAG: methyl-accepting chemotaxis protein [Negativicutes bacterium]|nr:methyl-accepting chemotaxis protein [Negativicutes bacterium]
MNSIQTKLTVTILAIFILAMSVLGGLNYWKARGIITDSVGKDMQELAVTSARDVGNWLESRKDEMAVMSVAPVVQGGDKTAIVSFLVNVAKTNKAYDGISYAALNGDYVNSLGVAGNVADREYFKKALTGETAISDPIVSKSSGHLVTVVAVPVKLDGKVVSVLYGAVDMAGLTKNVLDIKVGQTGYALVAQHDGLTIIHPDKEVAMKANPLKDPNADPGRKALTERIAKGEKGLTTLQAMGVDRYYAYAPVPGVNWGLAVTVPIAEATSAVSALTIISMITIVVVVIIAGLFITWFSRRIAKPIQQLEAAANRIAGGDISQQKLNIVSNDEIGRLGASFEQMTGNLRTLIQKVLGATEQVAAASEELTASAEQSAQAANQVALSITTVSAGVDEQLAAAGQTSIVVEQLSAGVQQMAASANQVAAQSAQAAEKATDGGKTVEKAVLQMSHIEETVNTSAQVVAKLGERSKEIGEIVGTISVIAGQTNLLALNAAIEAARAGEQGRGFAVVAEEVRKLAEQSQEAAKKIAELIGEIQGDTDKAVVAMVDGTREVKTGAEVVNAAGAAFREIAGLITQVSRQIKDISAATQQTATGSQQIVGSVKKIDELSKKSADEAQSVSAATEQQLASMEEIASSSEELAKLAQDLQAAIRQFRI